MKSHHFLIFIILIKIVCLPVVISGMAFAIQNIEINMFQKPLENELIPHGKYAFLKGDNIAVYSDPLNAAQGIPPVRYTKKGHIGVSLSQQEPIIIQNQVWYQINEKEYVLAENLLFNRPSQFQGVIVPRYFDKNFGWLIYRTKISSVPGGVTSEDDAPVLPRYTLVIIYEIREIDNRKWCRIGDKQWVKYSDVGMIKLSKRPEQVGKNEQWIEINLFEQTLAAYEGDQMVYATLISSGRTDFPTERGLFRIWIKARMAKMSGGEEGVNYYYLEDVPWHMYFLKSYAIHGTYWHDNFGIPHSRGCVNLAPKDAQWLFGWVGPKKGSTNWIKTQKNDSGTWVWIHE